MSGNGSSPAPQRVTAVSGDGVEATTARLGSSPVQQREEVVARFKTLTRLQDFFLEKDAANLPLYVTNEAFYQVIAREACSEGRSQFFMHPRGSHGRKCNINVAFSPLITTYMQCPGANATCSAGIGVAWNADVELAGSITGCLTLAKSEDSYLFNLSLPGMLQPLAVILTCDFDMDGEVMIEGEIATGGNTVESRLESLGPPGHFSLRFQLPSRVYSGRSNCNFGSNGIFEEIVKKYI
ncbi:increased DNA methylation 2-like [Eucalyptus grandis]|uniref:increased DNA methylation 2-like n=1 Tax=Eucalyptus grandis TaxID=71139 RepID=UPI00192EAB1F|nr:increased DNA methylation 2-like [Eucalyptus grandis]